MIEKKLIAITKKMIRYLERLNSKLRVRVINAARDRILDANQALQGSYQGKTCYILGNAPSLNNHDLLLLADHAVFCMNTFFVHKDFDSIKPGFYVFADPDLKQLEDPTIREWWMKLIVATANKGIIFFLPIQLKDSYVHEKLANERLHFVDLSLPFSKQSVKGFDLSLPVNGVQNVLVLTIQIAMYMGFTRIYLLGADHDWMSHFGNEQRHFYNPAETQVENVGSIGYSYSWWLHAVNTMFYQYKLIRKHIEKKELVKIYNASESGVLDVFPSIRYKDTFSEASE